MTVRNTLPLLCALILLSAHTVRVSDAFTLSPAPVIVASEPDTRLLPDVPLDECVIRAVTDTCDECGIPYSLALGLMWTESRFDSCAVSRAGCYGLCQLNPLYFPSDLSPQENARTGLYHLAGLIARYEGDVSAALTAYHDGHDTGRRGYANAVLDAAKKWEDAP